METMELSTSIPTPMAMPDRDMTLRVMPVKYIHTKATTTLAGMDSATIRVGRQSIRNSSRMSTASAPPQSRFFSTESTIMLI